MKTLPKGFQVYVVAMVMIASLALLVGASAIPWDHWPEMIMFVVLITLAAMFPIPNPRGGYITSASTLFYVLLCVHNPETTLLVSSVGFGLGLAISRGWVPWRMLFNAAQMGLSVTLASAAFHLSGGSLEEEPGVLNFLIPLALASLVAQASNNLFISWFLGWLRREPFMRAWVLETKDYLWSNLLAIPTAALLAILYRSVHPLTLLLYLVSLPAQRRAIQLYLQHRRIFGQAIDSLVVAIDTNFPGGKGHSRRVTDLAVAIARQLSLPDSVVDGIELGALVHDVGMIGLEELVKSSGKDAEAKLLEHVRIGADVARELPRRDVSSIILYHHEHFDGTGYLGTRGGQVPIGARIVAFAEAVESMIHIDPSEREGRNDQPVLEAIRNEAGRKFDPRVVKAFLDVLRNDPGAIGLLPGQSSVRLAAEPR